MKFFQKTLGNLPAPEKGKAFYFADEPIGLGVAVFSTGTKTLVYQGLTKTNKKRRITLFVRQ